MTKTKKTNKLNPIYLNEVVGASCTVRILKYSKCGETGKEICSYELEYPRISHSELLTHRVFSRNSSSTRAIPLSKVIDNIKQNPAKFIWTQNQIGMQGTPVCRSHAIAADTFKDALFGAVAYVLQDHQLPFEPHKQHIGRFLEAFQNIKVVLTTTEHANWDWLRIDSAAQPEIEDLASSMKQARDALEPTVLYHNEWHLPYVITKFTKQGWKYYHPETEEELSTKQAITLSRAACAQVSYRNLDLSDEAVSRITERLFGSEKIHSSPAEHQATPMPYPINPEEFFSLLEGYPDTYEGITHIDRKGQAWSGNFCGWIQGRHLIKGNTKY